MNSSTPKGSKASQGSVVVENYRNKLRLRWRITGERYNLSLGLEDTPENRKLAERQAKLIESDITNESFDLTLAKYKPQNTRNYASIYESRPIQPRMTVNQLFTENLGLKPRPSRTAFLDSTSMI